MTVEIYTMKNCGYCDESKKLLKENNYEYNEHILNNETANIIVKHLQEKLNTENITVPVTFIEDTSIIGYFGLVNFMTQKNQGS